MSHLRKGYVPCHYVLPPCHMCRMSNFRNTHVVLSLLGVKGRYYEWDGGEWRIGWLRLRVMTETQSDDRDSEWWPRLRVMTETQSDDRDSEWWPRLRVMTETQSDDRDSEWWPRLRVMTETQSEATLKNNSVSCRPAGWVYFTDLPGRIFFFFFFFFWKIMIFQPFFVRFSNGFHHFTQKDPCITLGKKYFGKKKNFPAARVFFICLTRSTGNRLFI